MPHAADCARIAIGDSRAVTAFVSPRVRGRSSAPVVKNTAPTILWQLANKFVAAIGVTIQVAACANDLIAQACLNFGSLRELMQQDYALEVESHHKWLLSIHSLLTFNVPTP